jgi:gluconokinase
MKYIIGIDIGTSGTKAIAFAVNGDILYSAYASYPMITKQQGEQELDPGILLEASVTTIGEIMRNSDPANKLIGIGFSSAMHSVIAVDKNGVPLSPVITWADLRSEESAAKIRNTDIGKRIYEHTGTPIHPMSPLCKIMWIRDKQPEIFSKTAKFISIKEYIWYHFFGKFLVDYSIASGTGLFDIRNFKWYDEALHTAGITIDHLSEAVSPLHIETDLQKKYQQVLGLPDKIPFVIGGSDGCLANLGSHAIEPGEMALTIGTSGAARLVSEKPKHDSRARIFNYILTEQLYVSGGAINNGGNVIRWWTDHFMNKPGSGQNNFAENLQEVADIPAGSEGLIFLPYLLGERAPVWDANAKGVFFGITPNHSSGHFLRAILEGIGFSLYSIGLSLEETVGPVKKIYASGGFINSDLWVQIVSDIFDKNVYVTNVADASATGAAMIGLLALREIKNLEETRTMMQIQKTFLPDKANHSVYLKNFFIFESLYEKLKDEFEKIKKL